MDLTVLGSSGTWPGPGEATCGYLVRHDGFCLWMDAGTGTFAELQRHISIGEIDAIVITHSHPDHFVDVYPCFYARHYGGLGEPALPLIGPADFYAHFADLVSEAGRDVASIAFDYRETAPGDVHQLGPFSVEAFAMEHLGIGALGYRVEAEGAVLAYTGDSGPTPEVIKLATGADVFVCEATWQDANDLLPFHMSARQAGEHATQAGVGRLLLTHIWPTLDKAVTLVEAREAFTTGPVDLAEQGLRIQVGS